MAEAGRCGPLGVQHVNPGRSVPSRSRRDARFPLVFPSWSEGPRQHRPPVPVLPTLPTSDLRCQSPLSWPLTPSRVLLGRRQRSLLVFCLPHEAGRLGAWDPGTQQLLPKCLQ